MRPELGTAQQARPTFELNLLMHYEEAFINSHHLLGLLQLKPYLVREQTAAFVVMLVAQSPLAQHVVSGDLNRLGKPAVEQRVVQWKGL